MTLDVPLFSCFQVLRLANSGSDVDMSDIPWALARPTSKSSSKQDLKLNTNPKYRVDELNEPPPRLTGIRSLLPLPGGDLLTGGTDLKIRRWDHSRFECKFYHFLSWNIKVVFLIDSCCLFVAVLIVVTVFVGQQQRQMEMMSFMMQDLVLGYKLCR